jgi:GNAT superfamily N-acetyltransferase
VPRARLGVVLALPAPVSFEIDGLRRAVGDAGAGGVAPHLTLVPPVNVASGEHGPALEAVRVAAAATPPLRLLLGPPASFWPATPVVYLDVGGDRQGVHRLRDRLDRAPWIRPTTWPFVPHVTIAPDVDPVRIPSVLAALAGYRREVTLTTVLVLREEPDRSWVPIADVALSGRRTVARGGLEVVIERGETIDTDVSQALAGSWVLGGDGEGRHRFALSAWREGEVVGAAAGDTDDELWLGRLAVDPAVRGQGIGRHLLRAVEAIGADRGCRRAFLLDAETPALRWFAAQGWHEDGSLVAWRGGRRLVRLTRDLPPAG